MKQSKKIVNKSILLAALPLSMISCQQPKAEILEKEVVKEIYKATDAQVLKGQYDLQASLFSKNLQGISDEEGDRRINNANSLKWIAGHTVWIHYNLAIMGGQAEANPYDEQFAFGKKFDPNTSYPSLAKMKADWDALTPKISKSLENLTEEQLNGESPFPIPFAEQTIRGVYAFQMHHLGYELGQMGLYRKFLEKSSFSYQ